MTERAHDYVGWSPPAGAAVSALVNGRLYRFVSGCWTDERGLPVSVIYPQPTTPAETAKGSDE